MKHVGETGRVAYKWKIFGWHIVIANSPLKFRQGLNPHRPVNYGRILAERRHISGCKCEKCGRDLTIYGRLRYLLPPGDPDRQAVRNVRLYCNSCYKTSVIEDREREGGEA